MLPLALVLLCAANASPEPLPPAFVAMVDAERAFVSAARAKGMRDSFLEWFAEDVVWFTPEPDGRGRLRNRPSLPFASLEVTWEPRVGDIAASGDLGWLTGPAQIVDRRQTPPVTYDESYLSVWRRQPDGHWRVVLDLGSSTHEPVPFDAGLHRFDAGPRVAGPNEANPTASLKAADAALDDALATADTEGAWRGVAAPGLRFHRKDVQPLAGRERVLAWLHAHPTTVYAATQKAIAAESGDLGYSFGAYRASTAATASAETGSYVRIWTRNAAGQWKVAVDVSQPNE